MFSLCLASPSFYVFRVDSGNLIKSPLRVFRTLARQRKYIRKPWNPYWSSVCWIINLVRREGALRGLSLSVVILLWIKMTSMSSLVHELINFNFEFVESIIKLIHNSKTKHILLCECDYYFIVYINVLISHNASRPWYLLALWLRLNYGKVPMFIQF